MAVRGIWVIARDSGISIFSKYYREPGMGDELFSGYMSALTSFLGELASDKEKRERLISLGPSYSLVTEDMKLLVRGLDNFIFVLAFDKTDEEELMGKRLRKLIEVFRAMYGERAKDDKKATSAVDYKDFELVIDMLIRPESEREAEKPRQKIAQLKGPKPLPRNLVAGLSFIKGINIAVSNSVMKGFDENKDTGYPIEMFSSDRKVTVSILFRQFLDQSFSDWVRLLTETIQKLNAFPDLERLHAALLYIDNCLGRGPKSTDRYTLQLLLSGSLEPQDELNSKSVSKDLRKLS